MTQVSEEVRMRRPLYLAVGELGFVSVQLLEHLKMASEKGDLDMKLQTIAVLQHARTMRKETKLRDGNSVKE